MTVRKNPHAVALGALGGAASKGKPKNYSAEELAKRAERMRQYNKRRKKRQQ